MALTGFQFLVFLLIGVLVYYVLPGKIRWIVLLLESFVFYYFAGGFGIFPWLIYGIVVSFVGGLILEEFPEGKKKTYLTGLFVVLLLVPLFFLKYIRFFGLQTPFGLIAPMGISFYTMSLIGYVIDTARGTVKAQRNILKIALFGSYFPQMTSGPILSYPEMEKEFFEVHPFDYVQVTYGAQRIAWGFFKKLVISERMAMIVNPIYDTWQAYSGTYLFIATVCFAFQLYTDFSGCMDIVIGASQLFGIKLPENFECPFFARNISEYWRRWHITLGVWFRNYLFYPLLKSPLFVKIMDISRKKLGKKKGKKPPTYLGMLVLWFTVGMWHGGSWNFIVGSGLLHWFYIVSGEILAPVGAKLIKLFRVKTETFSWHMFQSIRTFLLACLGFVFFRSPSLKTALLILKKMFSAWNPQILFDRSMFRFLDPQDLVAAIAGLLILLFVSSQNYKGKSVREQIASQNIVLRWAIYLGLLGAVLIFGCYGGNYSAAAFIYANF